MTEPPIVLMYSGQGSHYYQMGRALYADRPVFRAEMDRMDAIVRRLGGYSVLEALYDPARTRADPFDRLTVTHPAIFMVEYALTRTLAAAGIVADLVLGASLGTVAAATVAGCLSLDDALGTLVQQAAVLERRAERGAMVAVLADRALFEDAGLHRHAELAAVNFDSHFVVSTTLDRLPEVERRLRERQVAHQRLDVAYPFHSRWIEPVREPFVAHLRSLSWSRAAVPLVCCARAEVFDKLPDDHLWTVAREPIQFERTLRHLEARGPHRYLDVGPSGTLATVARYVLPKGTPSTVESVLTPFGRDVESLERVERNADLRRPPRPPVAAPPAEPTAFVFPGQGSQRRGMGAELFDAVPEYAAVEAEVDAIVGYSMRELCLDDPDNRLTRTEYTQPSLYIVNALHYYRALAEGAVPAYVAGHSLGEYNALLAAGVFDLLQGLRLVRKRGELMARAGAGGMAAVVGLSPERVAEVVRDHGLDAIDVANFNSSRQTVVSGPAADIGRAGPTFEAAGARAYVALQVGSAFHSRYMAAAAREFADFLAPQTLRAPAVPVIANVTAQPIQAGDPTATVASMLVSQITQPVRWTQSVRYLLAQGVTDFRELGPGNVLTKLVAQTRREG